MPRLVLVHEPASWGRVPGWRWRLLAACLPRGPAINYGGVAGDDTMRAERRVAGFAEGGTTPILRAA